MVFERVGEEPGEEPSVTDETLFLAAPLVRAEMVETGAFRAFQAATDAEQIDAAEEQDASSYLEFVASVIVGACCVSAVLVAIFWALA